MSDNALIACIIVACLLCVGEPDLIDALIHFLMRGC